MASLNRVTGKVFAGEAELENIGIFGSAKSGTPTNNTDVSTIQSLQAYLEGWTSGVVTSKNFPPVEEVNGALKTISYQACYCLQEGVAEYDSATEYKAYSFCKTNDTIYYSKQNNNINHSVSDTAWWGVVGDSRFVKKSGDTMSGNLSISKSNPYCILKNTDDSTAIPSGNRERALLFQTNNGENSGYIGNTLFTNGARYTLICGKSRNLTDEVILRVGFSDQNEPEILGITPNLSSYSTRLATTEFCREWSYGKYVQKTLNIISSNTSVRGSTDLKYELGTTGYLPSNYTDYPYEVYISAEGTTGTSVGDYMDIAIHSDSIDNLFGAKARCSVNGQADICAWAGWIPVSTTGSIYLARNTDWTGYVNVLRARGYRRLN